MKCSKVFLGGFNSTGKTALINTIADKFGRGIKICNGSDAFFNWLGLERGDYNSLENLPDGYKNVELLKMVNFLANQVDAAYPNNIWIFTGHFGIIKNNKVISVMGDWIENFDLIVLLTVDAETLIKRIKNDFYSGLRKRDRLMGFIENFDNPVKIFSKFLKQTEKISKELSIKYKIPLLKIDSSTHDSAYLASKILGRIKL